MKTTIKEYGKMVDEASPNSKIFKNIICAFLIGGTICTIGQVFIETYLYMGIEDSVASAGASITIILITGVLTGIGVFDNIAKVAGAGTLVPISGFANACVSPALEFKPEGMILGIGAKVFAISGPVLVYGIMSSFIYGIILFIAGVIA